MSIVYHPELGELELNRKKGRKNISIQYKFAEGKFSVSFPYNCPVSVAISFANSRIDWMLKTKNKSASKIIARHLGEINKDDALNRFTDIAENICKTTLLSYRNLKVRKMKTLWGSCSADNSINLNLYLANLPEDLQYYVILHELCHTVEKNHSKRFWNLLSSFWGEALKMDKELSKYVP